MRKSNYLGLAVTAVILLGYANVKAEMVANPDDNTLWIENGKDIKNGAEAFMMNMLDVRLPGATEVPQV